MVIAPFVVSLVVAVFSAPVLVAWLKRAGILGEDVHNSDQPAVSEDGRVSYCDGL